MTREMNKPDCHNEWVFSAFHLPKDKQYIPSNSRELDDWIKPFVQSINDRFKREEKCG